MGSDLTVVASLPADAVTAAVRAAEHALELGEPLSVAYDVAAEVVCQHVEIAIVGGRPE